MKIAAAAYRPEWHPDWAAMAAKLDAWVADAAGQGAALLIFPEYGGIESTLIGPPQVETDPLVWRDRMVAVADDWRDLHVGLARKYGVHILAGSLNTQASQGIVNRAFFCAPDGHVAHQDKLIMTPYERIQMQLAVGTRINAFDTDLGRIGVLICYDSEFPLQARVLVESGATMILVPSATSFPAGYTRVSQSCRARAIEGQCLMIQSPVLGPVPGCEIVDTDVGAAGFFCPPDYGLPDDGIIALGPMNAPGWVIADVDPAAIAAPRKSGQVGNYAHWAEQDHRVASVTPVRLTD